MTRSVAISWSGGKDAAFMLYELRQEAIEIATLVTTINEATDRSSMHGVRRELYHHQASSLDIPLEIVTLPPEPSNEVYEEVMAGVFDRLADDGVDTIAYGDLFLDDIRAYRQKQLADTPIDGWWPLWDRDSTAFMDDLLDVGFRPIITAVTGDSLDASFAGRPLDRACLEDFPSEIDPAGEHGEFHTFVIDGPTFSYPLKVARGRQVTREVGDTEIHYRDLMIDTP